MIINGIKIKPKFSVARMENVITLTMDLPMARDLFALLDDFNDLTEHEFALRLQLRNLIESGRRP